MKLCSVCDKKISGTWCSNCKRFVNPYNVPDDVYLNESHDPRNDANCTYHIYHTETDAKESTNQRNPVSTKRTVSDSQKSKSTKIVKWIIILYIVFVAFNVIGSILTSSVADVVIDSFEKLWKEDSAEDVKEDEVSLAVSLLKTVKPVETEQKDYEYYVCDYSYYAPEDIKKLGAACDSEHMGVEVKELEILLEQYFQDLVMSYEESLPTDNYLANSDGLEWTYFGSVRYYEHADSLIVSAGYDTATEELHGLFFAADAMAVETEDYYSLYHEVLRLLDSDYSDSKTSLTEKIEQATREAGNEYTTVVQTEKIVVYAGLDEDGYLYVSCYPSYAY